MLGTSSTVRQFRVYILLYISTLSTALSFLEVVHKKVTSRKGETNKWGHARAYCNVKCTLLNVVVTVNFRCVPIRDMKLT